MSTSSQPKAVPEQPEGTSRAHTTDQTVPVKGATVVPWPQQHRQQVISNARAALMIRRQAMLLKVIAEFNSETHLSGALIAVADTLKSQLGCSRVSLALCRTAKLNLAAISQQAQIDAHTTEAELLCAVMQEALDKDATIATDAESLMGSGMQAHRLLCAGRPDRQVVSVPVCHEGKFVGALCVERDATVSMTEGTIALLRCIADSLGPLIHVRLLAERSVVKHMLAGADVFGSRVISIRYMKWKLAGVLVLLIIAIASLWQVAHTVKAQATLVPLERRVISAPRDGYIQSVSVGSGDRVVAGQLLLNMNISDLELERVGWQGELTGLSAQMRSAMAKADRRQMSILAAQIDKTRSQLALADASLERAEVRAPVDGIVVSAELSQMMGAPVSRGQLLAELAPENGYEVHLMVDESRINRVSLGDSATLHLRADPGNPLALQIEKIHPIGIAENGVNTFRVTAGVLESDHVLLPGQTGIGQIEIGEASLLHVLTEGFRAWLRLKRWEWLG